LSFFTILILIHSLSEQVSANKALKEDIADNKRTEKLRSFDSLFFNMIKIQKDFYDNLEVEKISKKKDSSIISYIKDLSTEKEVLRKSDASDYIINTVNSVIIKAKEDKKNIDPDKIIELFDKKEHIYNMCRSFYLCTKTIEERLSDKEGFSEVERKNYYKILINFTELSNLILIAFCMEKSNNYGCKELNYNNEFISTLKELNFFEKS
jgi:hypothetical protein